MPAPRSPQRPPVGVVAPTLGLASSLARELNLTKAIPISLDSSNPKGAQLGAIVVEESCWPLPPTTVARLLPCLVKHAGYIYRVQRIDPRKKKHGTPT